jgi:hypothetical protein
MKRLCDTLLMEQNQDTGNREEGDLDVRRSCVGHSNASRGDCLKKSATIGYATRARFRRRITRPPGKKVGKTTSPRFRATTLGKQRPIIKIL